MITFSDDETDPRTGRPSRSQILNNVASSTDLITDTNTVLDAAYINVNDNWGTLNSRFVHY